MKYNKILGFSLLGMLGMTSMSCSDFLEKEPLSEIAPEQYYSSASQLNTILMERYEALLPGHGSWYGNFANDNNTDNQISTSCSSVYTTDQYRSSNEDGSWYFSDIYHLNFALSQAMPRYGENLDGSQNTISGTLSLIQHYLGELYYLRAYVYYSKLRAFGDFPIVLEPLPNDKDVLIEATIRRPRNEVARQILEDLDKAIYLMQFTNLPTTRINRDVALQFKSRVALYEGTWLKYFKGTAFVPGGEGWPGAKFYPDYQYPSGSIENESNFFFDECMKAAKEVGDKYVDRLTYNTGYLQQSVDEDANPYYNMFSAVDMSTYPEILMWRDYDRNLLRHDVGLNACKSNGSLGMTRQYVQNFLMEDGTPVYTHGTYADGDGYYMGDKDIAGIRENRDSRLKIFLKAPGDINQLYDLDDVNGEYLPVENIPDITSGVYGTGYPTGYALHKGGNFSRTFCGNQNCYFGCIIMRAAESLLNYMEASYERNGRIDETADRYWKAIRTRAHVDPDYSKTIGMTDMTKEAENDWGAYSGGQLIDETLYNIRRERRCEFLSEGFRYSDLKRWRSFDQLITTPAHLEGMHLWNTPMQGWYDEKTLVYGGGSESTVSSPNLSEYLRPFERYSAQFGFNGMTWKMGHYLDPISIKQILLSTSDGITAEESKIYQNPYWSTTGAEPASK